MSLLHLQFEKCRFDKLLQGLPDLTGARYYTTTLTLAQEVVLLSLSALADEPPSIRSIYFPVMINIQMCPHQWQQKLDKLHDPVILPSLSHLATFPLFYTVCVCVCCGTGRNWRFDRETLTSFHWKVSSHENRAL